MNGARIVINTSGLDRLQERLDRIAGIGFRDVLDTVGAVVESQARRRISTDQEAPDGTPWAAWSDAYAAKRHGGHSLLDSEGHLIGSITHNVGTDDVEIGSNLEYAAIHQFGLSEPVKVPGHQRVIRQAFGRQLSFPVSVNVGSFSLNQNIQARPYLGLSGDDEQEITAVIERWIEELLA